MQKKEEEKEEIKKIDKKMIFFYIFMALFIILTVLVFTKVITPVDEWVESLMIGIRNDKLTKYMSSITNIGGAYALIALSTLLLFVIKNKKIPLSIIVNLITIFLTSQVFKFIFRRPRPDGVLLVSASGYSYPSGHAMVSMAYFTFLAYLLCKKINSKFNRFLVIAFNCLLILAIAFSRVYLGVHYFSDVLAGLLLGGAYLMLFMKLTKGEKKKK